MGIDDHISLLSDRDPDVRRRSIAALGESRDRRAVEPLLFALSRELALGAESHVVVIDIAEALEKIPDSRSLDLLLKIESQLIDYGSPACKAGMPVGSTFYLNNGQHRVGRIVPREFHYKVFESMRRISAALGDRAQVVSGRFYAYQRKVMAEEVDRLMVRLAEALESSGQYEPEPVENYAVSPTEGTAAATSKSGKGMTASGSHYGKRIKREMELQIVDYIRNNEDMLAIIRQGQRIKASMQQAREARGKMAQESTPASAQAYVR